MEIDWEGVRALQADRIVHKVSFLKDALCGAVIIGLYLVSGFGAVAY